MKSLCLHSPTMFKRSDPPEYSYIALGKRSRRPTSQHVVGMQILPACPLFEAFFLYSFIVHCVDTLTMVVILFIKCICKKIALISKSYIEDLNS